MLEILVEHINNPNPNSLRVFSEAVNRMRQGTLPSNLFKEKIQGDGDILIKAIQQRPISSNVILVIRYLLQVKNTEQLPYIDINNVDRYGKTAMHHLLDNNDIPEDVKAEFFDLMLDLRGRNAELLIDFSACRWHHGTPLMDAIRIRNPNFVRSILDIRLANGNYAVNVNEARSHPPHTALDVAYMHLLNDDTGRQIERALINRGARRYISLNPGIAQAYRSLPSSHGLHPNFDPVRYNRLIPQNPPEDLHNEQHNPIPNQIIEPRLPENGNNGGNNPPPRNQVPNPIPIMQDQQINNIINDAQNTHLSAVTNTVNISVNRLKNRYLIGDFNRIFVEIQAELERFNLPDDKINVIRNGLANFEKHESVRSGCNLTLKQVSSLIWTGVKDKTAMGVPNLTDQDIEDRKLTFFNKIYQSQTEYAGRPACFVGCFNKVVETLDLIHSDVTIGMSQIQIYSLAVDRSFEIVKQELLKKPIREQHKILKNWWVSEENNIAYTFKIAMKDIVSSKLLEEFSAILDDAENKIDGIVSLFETDLEIPNICEKLFQLIEKISKLKDDHYSAKELKVFAINLENCDNSLEEQYKILFVAYLEKIPALIKSKNELESFFNKNEFSLSRLQKQLFTLRYHLYALEKYEQSIYPNNPDIPAKKLIGNVLAEVKTIDDKNWKQVCTKIYGDIESYKQNLEPRDPASLYLANILLIISLIGWAVKYLITGSCFFQTNRENLANEISESLDQDCCITDLAPTSRTPH